MTHKERQEKAIHAAVRVGDRLGMTLIAPVILTDSNYTSIHLGPFPIVARVVASTAVQRAGVKLAKELSVAKHLARVGALVVAPTVDVRPGAHFEAD